MKTLLLRFAFVAALLLASATEPAPAIAARPPESGTPLEWSTRMADSEMGRLGKKLCAPKVGSGSWDYTTGLYSDALLRLTGSTGNPVYEKSAETTIGSFIGPTGTIATYAPKKKDEKKKPKTHPPTNTKRDSNNKKLPPAPVVKPKGKKPVEGYSLDKVQSGVATLKLYDLTREERYRKAADILRNQLRKQPRVDEGGFWHKGYLPDQMWLDGLYMAEPFYADYATRFGEPQDFDDIAKQFRVVEAHTYDPKTGLLYHGWDASKKLPWANPKTGASPHFWSRAMGWYAMGLVDVLAVMPPDDPRRPELMALFREVTNGILKYQDPKSGVWWQITDQGYQPNNYLEASASCMFVYALAKGVNHGYLPRSDIPAIRAGYQGIMDRFVTVSFDRKTVNLTRCCLVVGLDIKYKASYDYYTRFVPIVSNDLKGVGPFINAGIECDKLFGREAFTP